MTESASVVMSFDFEMRWGVHDLYGLNFDSYRENLENCRPAVKEMLNLLTERNLRATWATVGALAMNGWDDYFSNAPPVPAYQDENLVVRREYADMDPDGKFHFAPDLVSEIAKADGQDLGSHSFSHLYFREKGVTENDFIADMAAVERVWKERFDDIPSSLVFPRNQSAFLDKLNKTSIKMWRGNESAWFYDCMTKNTNTILPRAYRLIDSINPLTSRASKLSDGMVRTSIFVRFGLSDLLWKFQVKKIESEIKNLSAGEVCHLWWHPHNLGSNFKRSIKRLTQVLDIVSESCLKKDINSLNMKDCIELQ